jgi:hypothetical protein
MSVLSCQATIFGGMYPGNPKMANSKAIFLLTKIIGHYKLVICMTTYIHIRSAIQ